MKSLIGLELRKQRKIFLGLLLIIVLCLTVVTASVSTFGGLPADESFLSITVMLQAFGLPFFGLLLGGSAGAALRSSERKGEEDIPVHPAKRVFVSYCASLIYLAILATVLFAASTPLNYSASLQEDFEVPLMMIVLLPLHSAAFVFSYWLSQAVLGSVVSMIVTIAPAYWLFLTDSFCSSSYQIIPRFLISILAFVFFPFWIFGGWDFILISLKAAPGLIATMIHLSLMGWVVNRIEREKRTWLPMKIAIAVVLLSALSLSVWGVFFFAPNLLISSDELIAPYYESRREIITCGPVN